MVIKLRKNNDKAQRHAIKLENYAYIDLLTRILNRRGIEKVIKELKLNSNNNDQKYAILVVDIDHFKQVNDTYGHLVGDAVLKEVADRMTAVLRPYDHIGRYGGEEFLLVLNTRSDQISNTFERLRLAIANTPFKIEHLNLNVTMSLGVSNLLPTAEKRDAVALISSADKSLYKAKDIGRNCVVSLGQ